MDSFFIEKGNTVRFKEIFNQINSSDHQSMFVLLSADNGFDEEFIDLKLKSSNKALLGGIFPELVFNGKRASSGAVILALDHELMSLTISSGMNEVEIMEKLENRFSEVDIQSGTLCMFFDALGQEKTFFIQTIFNFFGTNVSYIGAGAGSLDFVSFPCVMSNEGLSKGSMSIGFIPETKDLGFSHGWTSVSDSLKVTKAEGNKVININHRPAWEVYKEIVSSHSKAAFERNNFFDIAKSYPLGIAVMDAEMIVRDLYALEEDGLMVVDEIKEGEYISVLNGNVKSLLRGARNARMNAYENVSSVTQSSFCIDCISRVLFLEEEFDNELSIVKSDGQLSGVLSIGEIANKGDAFLEIYNKIVVVVKW